MSTPVALVTAGSAGLGAAIVHQLAEAGYWVFVNYYTNDQRAETLVQELGTKSGRPAVLLKADLSDHQQVRDLVSQTIVAAGRLDVVISNGGWTEIRGLSSLDDNMVEADWDRCYVMNVKSHLWLMHAAREALEEADGAFVLTSSLAGVKVSGSSLAYSVTKAAQIHLMKGLALMTAPRIRVNSVSPSLMMTDWGHRFSEEQKQKHRDGTKLGRFVTTEDVAAQVLCFVKSRSVTGMNAIIDAGTTL